MKWKLPPVPYIGGLHYAVRILIGTTSVWFLTQAMHFGSPVWALISVIVVSEPHMKAAWTTFVARFINTIVGCVIGLLFLLGFGPVSDLLPLAATLTALFSIYLTRMQQGWRIGPVTTAIVMSAGLAGSSTQDAVSIALERAASVLIGSAVALTVTLLMARIWVPTEPGARDDGKAA